MNIAPSNEKILKQLAFPNQTNLSLLLMLAAIKHSKLLWEMFLIMVDSSSMLIRDY
jgi:hypothetical protein